MSYLQANPFGCANNGFSDAKNYKGRLKILRYVYPLEEDASKALPLFASIEKFYIERVFREIMWLSSI